jgi:hypothetical protein
LRSRLTCRQCARHRRCCQLMTVRGWTKASSAEMTGGIIGDLITMAAGGIESTLVQDEDMSGRRQDF